MVTLVDQETMDKIVSHLEPVSRGIREEAEAVGAAAKAGLEEARASTRWVKIYPELSPPHVTRISVEHGTGEYTPDSFVNLHALNPMALEFGHSPSGVFGPGGKLAHVKTRAPEGLYLLHKAAGFGLE